MKIPNRDSGIDSPSASVAGESFPCEDGGEAPPGPAGLGLHPETAISSQVPQDAPREEADSDVSEEPDSENKPLKADEEVGPAQVGLPLAPSPPWESLEVCGGHYLCLVLKREAHRLAPH